MIRSVGSAPITIVPYLLNVLKFSCICAIFFFQKFLEVFDWKLSYCYMIHWLHFFFFLYSNAHIYSWLNENDMILFYIYIPKWNCFFFNYSFSYAAIHQEAPAFADMSVQQEILETGIKVVDLLAPYARGGKIGTCVKCSFFFAFNMISCRTC